jgi:hypothetical protein
MPPILPAPAPRRRDTNIGAFHVRQIELMNRIRRR